MLDEETARSVEQEAIALVSLSNSSQFAAKSSKSDVAVEGFASSTASKCQDDATSKMDAKEDAELIDGNISMKSLLVTLKKRKLQHAEVQREDEDQQLPSFRAVFQPQPQATRSNSGASTDSTPTPTAVTTETTAVTGELKCKYRTGKCHNVRALKSCGDYHNLCNYHRLRANANQRKLDRKKKEQRMQQQQLTADALASNEPSPTSPKQPTMASSHAAAAALASLVAAQPQHQFDMLQQRQFFASGVAMQDAAMAEDRRNRSTSSVRPKQEDACSY